MDEVPDSRCASGSQLPPALLSMVSTSQSSESSSVSPSASDGSTEVPHSLNTQVRTLLLECSDRRELATRILGLCARQFGSTVERCDLRVADATRTWVSRREEMSDELAERFSREFMEPMSRQVCSDSDPQPRLKQLRRGDQHITVLSVPVLHPTCDSVEGAITLLIGGQPRPEVVLPRLDGIAAMVSAVLAVLADTPSAGSTVSSTVSSTDSSTEPATAAATAATANAAATPAAGVLPATEAAARASQFASTREYGYSLVNTLCDQLNAEQVFFGVERRQSMEVEAVSSVADFKAGSPGVAIVRQAMEECLDAGHAIVHQQPPLPETTSMPIHRQWSSTGQQACVCSVPLMQDQQVTGVISLRRAADRPLTAADLQRLHEILTPCGAAVRLIDRANAPVSRVMRSAVGDSMRRLTARGHSGRHVLLTLAAAALLWFLLGSITYRPLCAARVTAADLHHIAAPFDGQLKAVHVAPGDAVRAGDLLLEFDTTELRLEMNRLTRDLTASDVRLRESVRLDDISQAAIVRSHIGVLEAQAAAVRRQIEDASVFAPRDGTVILADLDQRVGQEFSQGDELLQFNSGQAWLLEIEVPDDIVHYIATEQSGTFAAAALPTDQQEFLIESIDGAATTRSERNVFVARAAMDAQPSWMRSGMEGTARITSVPRPVWWVTLHRGIDWLRARFWI